MLKEDSVGDSVRPFCAAARLQSAADIVRAVIGSSPRVCISAGATSDDSTAASSISPPAEVSCRSPGNEVPTDARSSDAFKAALVRSADELHPGGSMRLTDSSVSDSRSLDMNAEKKGETPMQYPSMCSVRSYFVCPRAISSNWEHASGSTALVASKKTGPPNEATSGVGSTLSASSVKRTTRRSSLTVRNPRSASRPRRASGARATLPAWHTR